MTRTTTGRRTTGRLAVAAALLALGQAVPASAQQDGTSPQTAPPEVMPQTPKLGDTSQPTTDGAGSLSDKLSGSEGVITPPAGGAGTDPGIVKPTPGQEGGSMVVIPPPGSPGGDQSVRPK